MFCRPCTTDNNFGDAEAEALAYGIEVQLLYLCLGALYLVNFTNLPKHPNAAYVALKWNKKEIPRKVKIYTVSQKCATSR